MLKILKYVALFVLLGPALFTGYLGLKLLHRRHPEWFGDDSIFNGARRTSPGSVSSVYSSRKGWNVRELPLGMTLDRNLGKGRATFDCAGISELITGEAKSGRAEFRFDVPDLQTATRVSEKFSGDVSVFRTDDGRFRVSSGSARAACAAAEFAFPSRDVPVSRELKTVRQYVVSGCRNYEEAAAKLRDSLGEYMPLNSYIASTDVVDGRRSISMNGSPLSAADLGGRLAAGDFIVSEVETMTHADSVKVPLNAGAAAVDAAVRENFVPSVANLGPEGVCSSFVDSTPEGLKRFMTLEDGREVRVADARELSGLKLCVMCPSFEAACSLADGGAVPEGLQVFVGKDVPMLPSGDMWPVTSDVDGDVVNMLGISGGASLSDVARLHARGFDGDSIAAGRLLEMVGDSGATNMSAARKRLSLVSARVGGVPVGELVDRKASGSLPSLDGDSLRRWAEDAGHIQSVTFDLDPKSGMMRITSVVDGVQTTAVRPVTEEEMEAYRVKGQLTEAEKKDLLIQIHPDYFKSYSAGGKSVFEGKDPVGDFLKNRVPKRDENIGKIRQDTLRNTLENNVKPKTGPRLG